MICIRYLNNNDFKGYGRQYVPIALFLLIFDVTLSWLVVGLFINKLFNTIMFRSRKDFFEKTGRYFGTFDGSNINDDNNNNHNHNHNDKERGLQIKPSPSPVASDQDIPNHHENKEERKEEEEVEAYSAKQRHSARVKAIKQRSSSHQRNDSFLIDLAFASIDDKDKERLAVVTRQLVLSSLSIITTQICYVSIFIFLVISLSSDTMRPDQSILFAVYGGVFYPSEVILNCTALYLNYGFAQKTYDILCSCCHRQCGLCVLRRASRKILRTHSEEISKINVHGSEN